MLDPRLLRNDLDHTARLLARRGYVLDTGQFLALEERRKALQVRDGGCAIPGCRIRSGYTQPHHITPWTLGGATDLDAL